MSSMHDMMRAPNLMTDVERAELLAKGWQPEVVDSLQSRGFRPCKPDFIAARFEGASIDRTMGFLRQTRMPHLYITIEKDTLPHVVLERIDNAIHDCGRLHGHESIASSFMSFFERVKQWKPSNHHDLEARVARLEENAGAEAQPPANQKR